MRRPAIAVLVLSLSLGLLTGCATQTPADEPSGSPASPATTSTTTGSAPPSTPAASMSASDQLPGNVLVGTVTADSSGPCYLVMTDDGVAYALIGQGGTVTRGQRVRALTENRPSAVDCGPGRPLGLVKLEVSG